MNTHALTHAYADADACVQVNLCEWRKFRVSVDPYRQAHCKLSHPDEGTGIAPKPGMEPEQRVARRRQQELRPPSASEVAAAAASVAAIQGITGIAGIAGAGASPLVGSKRSASTAELPMDR